MPTPESGQSLSDEEIKILTQWVSDGKVFKTLGLQKTCLEAS